MDSSQPATILSGQLTDKPFLLKRAPSNKSPSYRPELMNAQFGRWKITSPHIIWKGGYDKKGYKARFRYVQALCTTCGTQHEVSLDNILKGLSKGCLLCSNPRQTPAWLYKRLTAAQQRCTNPNDPGFKNYGARGITFNFASVLEACLWVQTNLGLHRHLELDRIDNSKGYAPDNLRWATHRQNNLNKQLSKIAETDIRWAETQSPYALNTTLRLLRQGFSQNQILAQAKQAVQNKRKAWKSIALRLEQLGYTTSSTPALDTALR